jgi:hypothetical protein
MIFRMEPHALFPSSVDKVYTPRADANVGTTFEINYMDGVVRTCQITIVQTL